MGTNSISHSLVKENEPFRAFIQSSSAIPFLQVSYLRLAWNGLKNSVPEQPEYSYCIAYFERTSISGTFTLKLWNHCDNSGPRLINFYQRSRHFGIDILAQKT